MTPNHPLAHNSFEAMVFDAMVLAGLQPGMLHEWNPGESIAMALDTKGNCRYDSLWIGIDSAYGLLPVEINRADDAMQMADKIAAKLAAARGTK